MSTRETRELARQLDRTKRDIRALSIQNGLNHSSIEDGHVGGYDRDGTPTVRLGKQHDGTHTSASLSGPTPPTPTAATLTPYVGGLKVRWEGTFVGEDVVAPMDFSRVEVHAHSSPFTPTDNSTLRGTVESPRGGDVVVPLDPQLQYVRLVARSQSGKPSAPSDASYATPAALDPNDFKGQTIFYNDVSEPPADPVLGDLWLQAPSNVAYRYGTDGTWAALQDQGVVKALQDAKDAADDAADAAAIAGAKGKVWSQTSPPSDATVGPGDLWIDTDDGNRLYSRQGNAWVSRRLGSSSIQPNSLVARDVIATGTVSAALLEATLVLATTIVAGDSTGDHVELTSAGFRVLAADPVDGVPNEVIRLGTSTADYLGITDGTGAQVAGIDQTGKISGQNLVIAGDPIFGGDPLSKLLAAVNTPNFQIAELQYSTPSPIGSDEFGIMEAAFQVIRNRRYEIKCKIRGRRADTTPQTEFVMRVRNGGANRPDITSALLVERQFSDSVPGFDSTHEFSFYFVPAGTGLRRLLLSVYANGPSGANVSILSSDSSPISMSLEDKGPASTVGLGVMNDGGGKLQGGTVTPPPATPPPAVQRYVNTYLATWTQTFRGDGGLRTDVGTQAIQGYYPGSNGNEKALIGFPSALGDDVQGATIEKIEVFLNAQHWYYNSGGTLVLGTHLFSAAPGNWTPANGIGPDRMRVTGWPYGGLWIDVTAMVATGLQDRTVRGLSLGPGPDNNLLYYGRFSGSGDSNPPTFRVTFTK